MTRVLMSIVLRCILIARRWLLYTFNLTDGSYLFAATLLRLSLGVDRSFPFVNRHGGEHILPILRIFGTVLSSSPSAHYNATDFCVIDKVIVTSGQHDMVKGPALIDIMFLMEAKVPLFGPFSFSYMTNLEAL